MSKRRKIVIVGGSLTGLMVAKLCQECDVIILEQNNALYSGKYDGGLSLGPWGQKVFDAHIPAPELLDRTIRTKWLSIFTLDHAEMERMQKEGGVPRDYTQPVAEEHRVVMTTWAAVYQTLLQDIDVDSEIDWKTASEGRPRLRVGAKVDDAQYKDGTWTITYRSTATNHVETETADILVAADGAHSTIRRVTLSDVAPSYTGVVAWRGRVPDGVVVDRDEEIRNDLLVWYRMLRSQYIILYAVPILGSTTGNDGAVIEWCWYHPYVEGTDPELEAVMTTFADQEQLVETRAKKWKDCLEAAKNNFPKSVWKMLSQCETPWITKVTAADGNDEGTNDEGTDDEEGDQSSDSYATSLLAKKLLFAGEAYAQIPPYLGLSFDNSAEQALAIHSFLRGESDEEAFQNWQSEATAMRLKSSKRAGKQGRALAHTET